MMKRTIFAVIAVLCLSSAASAEEAQMFFQREAVGAKAFPAAPRIARTAGLAPAATLRAATESVPEEIEKIRVWNEQGRVPQRNGFRRSLGETIDVQIGAAVAGKSGAHERGILARSDRGIVWATSFKVEKAARLRVHLEDVKLPAGAVLWVYGESGEATAFDATLIDDKNTLWTPSVNGDTVYLELEVPTPKSSIEAASFKVKEVLELLYVRGAGPRPKTDDTPTCLVNQDVTCKTPAEFPALVAASSAVGQMEFVVSGGGAVCSGALITDRAQSGTPYFLTANHCLDSQAAASSLETYFDFKFESCVSSNFNFLPPIGGATLLATGDLSRSDYTLLRLPAVPSNRVFLGWTTTPVTNGTRMHRISHPVPDGFNSAQPQIYSRTIVKNPNSNPQCNSIRPPNFIFSNESNGGVGGVYGGSSGSPAMLDNGQIVGQLLGSCGGVDPQAGCDRNNDTLDGSFASTYPFIKSFIDPTGGAQQCVPSSTEICLLENRFAVNVKYNDGSGQKNMTAIKYTGESGLFWFTDAGNIEILLKMIDACTFNARYWVYVGGTTDVEVLVTVRDSRTGLTKTYLNPRGAKYGTVTDSNAFATCQ